HSGTLSYSIDSGDGNDTVDLQGMLVHHNYSSVSLSISVDTGAGDDTIYLPNAPDNSGAWIMGANGGLQLNAGDGNDVVYIGNHPSGSFGLSLRAGSDHVVFGGWTGLSTVTISDFDTGPGGDSIDLGGVW